MTLMTYTAEWDEFAFFRAQRRWEQKQRFMTSTPGPTLTPALPLWGGGSRNYERFGRRVEVIAGELLADRGHVVQLTGHNEAWDILAGGARVEVKGARWSGRRYQAAIRNDAADVVLLGCIGDGAQAVLAWFVIPGRAIGQRRNVTIWSADPRAYKGRWAAYLERWDVADELIKVAGPAPKQLCLRLDA